jgi:hypothetical protein
VTQNPSLDIDDRSVGLEFSCLLWVPKAHFPFPRSPSLVFILNQISSNHTLVHYFVDILLFINVPSGFLLAGVTYIILCTFRKSPMILTCYAHDMLELNVLFLLFLFLMRYV